MAPSPDAISQLSQLPALVRKTEGYGELVRALRAGESGNVEGAWASAGALATAALAGDAPGCVLCVCPHVNQVEDFAEDLESFSGRPPLLFPTREHLPNDTFLADETFSSRLRVVTALGEGAPAPIVTSVAALLEPVPSPEALERQSRLLSKGSDVDVEGLAKWLVTGGFDRHEMVELPGEFSLRGGILDIFPFEAQRPVRVELWGDTVESIRTFDAASQRSQDPLDELRVLAGGRLASASAAAKQTCHLADCLPAGTWVVLVEMDQMAEEARQVLGRLEDVRGMYSWEGTRRKLGRHSIVAVSWLPLGSGHRTWPLRVESVDRLAGKADGLAEELDSIAPGGRVVVACDNEAEAQRLGELLAGTRLAESGRLDLIQGKLTGGFRLVEFDTLLVAHRELFHRYGQRRRAPKRRPGRAIESFLELRQDDFVVHVAHGIGLYRGTKLLERNGGTEEHVVIEFARGTLLYVPSSKIDLVQKYVGGPTAVPSLSTLGGRAWQRRKDIVSRAVHDVAVELLDRQAARQTKPGIAYPADGQWQKEFEASFPYDETPDQLTVNEEIKSDMQAARPMDRLICGDVGYGKTELAVRAAFKAVDYGKQVAVLVPTTVLAEQHYRTFSERLADYPFLVGVISRFKTRAQQREILKRLREGKIDIIIGTHRLVQSDVELHDLGLVIIDEEQRFGVEHKERLKALRETVDVLTLTATPIPRTLHMAMLGLRDIANLTTPPPDRLAIETRITRFDPQLVKHAIARELNRDGQVYFVHNRVNDIQHVAEQVRRLVPEARIVVGHGQMPEHQLSEAMAAFVAHRYDILVATTIIESGLDIPNVNTIFINEAENYGLADLHQLRGRVGRYRHRAYAYLLVSGRRPLTPVSASRLKAIEEFTELGAGFQIAMRDLEIRGAGNILGAEQSGHIVAIGYELYCRLLEQAVRALKAEPIPTPVDVRIELGWPAYLPHRYVPGHAQRIHLYRQLRATRAPAEIDAVAEELKDRFGPIPTPADHLLTKVRLAALAQPWQIESIRLDGTDVVLAYRQRSLIEQLSGASGGRLKIVSDAEAYLRLPDPSLEPSKLARQLIDLLSG